MEKNVRDFVERGWFLLCKEMAKAEQERSEVVLVRLQNQEDFRPTSCGADAEGVAECARANEPRRTSLIHPPQEHVETLAVKHPSSLATSAAVDAFLTPVNARVAPPGVVLAIAIGSSGPNGTSMMASTAVD